MVHLESNRLFNMAINIDKSFCRIARQRQKETYAHCRKVFVTKQFMGDKVFK
jgi:hypothetical protein